MVRPHLVVWWRQEAHGRVQRLRELVMCSVKHACDGSREALEDLHGVCVVKHQLAFVIIHPHSDPPWTRLPGLLTRHMQVVVPSREAAVPKLHAPGIPVSPQFGALVPALPFQAGVGDAHGPGGAAADVHLPVRLRGGDGRSAQGAAHSVKLKRALRT